MDEKGDNALDMGDDEPEKETGEQSTQAQESEPDRAEDIQAVAEEPLKPVASFLMSERIAEHAKRYNSCRRALYCDWVQRLSEKYYYSRSLLQRPHWIEKTV